MGRLAAMRAPPGGQLTPPAVAGGVEAARAGVGDLPSACCPETRNTGRGIHKVGERQRGKGRDTSEGVITAPLSE